MLHVPPSSAAATPAGSASGVGSASSPEKSATSPSEAQAPARKPRSCMVCRNRKVRCDKQSPCSNCRRAGIACVLPPTDRPPRWARRLERLNANAPPQNTKVAQDAGPAVGQVMDRLRSLEGLVKELSTQLEQANAAVASSNAGGSSGVNSPDSPAYDREAGHHAGAPSPAGGAGAVQKQFGRMVLHDAGSTRYISSGFWSRVSDELHGLEMDTRSLAGEDSDDSEDDASSHTMPSTQELARTPAERHGFIFRHNLNAGSVNLQEFHPLPSQVPFLLNVYADNVNHIVQIVHMPTVENIVRVNRKNGFTELSPSEEALLFAIYYAAVTSMEDDDVLTNFGTTKSELNLRYRVGLEHALSKADFLNIPSIVLVQAFAIFLFLVRRYDSPRFVWMMTGLVIRMAQALGLHKDGSKFPNITPYEIEIRRRVWWSLCLLDLRSSEDQGTDLTIGFGSFDTKVPLNIHDADIGENIKEPPIEQTGITEMTIATTNHLTTVIVRKMMALLQREQPASMDEKDSLLAEIYEQVQHTFLQHTANPNQIDHWVVATCTRLVVSKMTLYLYLPFLFTSGNDPACKAIYNRLLVCAIEIAEHNHVLNAEEKARQWRWIYQTYTHWHAIVYIMLDIARRPWSPLIERAWVALHSNWLIPAQTNLDKNVRIWVPLRKLMAKVRLHRTAELDRLQRDPRAAQQLAEQDGVFQLPASAGVLSAEQSANSFRERWWKLVAPQTPSNSDSQLRNNTTPSDTAGSTISGLPRIQEPGFGSDFQANEGALHYNEHPGSSEGPGTAAAIDIQGLGSTQGPDPMFGGIPAMPSGWSATFFDDVDIEMDIEAGDIDWYNWVETAQGMEMPFNNGAGPPS